MGKYMKKSKITAEVSLPEVSPRSSMALGGVRTRAKTLALRRLHMNSIPNPNLTSPSSSSSSSSNSYLELRSRRLRRPPQTPVMLRNQLPRPKQGPGKSPNFCPGPDGERTGISPASSRLAIHSDVAASASLSCEEMQGSCEGHFGESTGRSQRGTGCGASEESYGGEKNLEPDEQTDRRASSIMTRRLIQGDDTMPGIPTACELDEFFAFAEREQQRQFIEKYNFDVLTDTPLPGRFEWVRVRP